jgi:hypothetical protein
MKSQRKNSEIQWSVEELSNWSESPKTFILMVISHGWLNNIYDGNEQQNNRLMFIRKWWAKNVQQDALNNSKPKKPKFEVKQLKLF